MSDDEKRVMDKWAVDYEVRMQSMETAAGRFEREIVEIRKSLVDIQVQIAGINRSVAVINAIAAAVIACVVIGVHVFGG
ncbi:hypothetical protein [Thioalkalivibrio sp. HK1]|uniref:hypothetical protein n=1 Tax=Thioalkalivibrio sp. HK1 TaxID=1469245 RepID=UPI0004704063|nr:hypothetical protein [Thioalkalivibrio sp. HK1]